MPTTYVSIASQTLSTTTASVTFSSIPGTYTDLVVRISGRSNAGSSNSPLYITFNSATTNFSYTRLWYSSTSPVSDRSSSTSQISIDAAINGSLSTTNTFSNNEIYIPNYTVSANKPVFIDSRLERNDTGAWGGVIAGLWSNTSAITSITLTPATDSWVSGSTFYLYGIKNS